MSGNNYTSQMSDESTNFANNIALINQGANLQIADTMLGASLSAQGHNQAASGIDQVRNLVGQSTQFNLSIQATNTLRQLQNLSNAYTQLSNKQTGQMAATGLSVNSASFNVIAANALNDTATQILNTKIDAQNQRTATLFTSDLQEQQLQNEANAERYQAQVSLILGARKAQEIQYSANAQMSALNQSVNNEVGNLYSPGGGVQ